MDTLTQGHLWLSQSIGFIIIKLHSFDPTSYTVSLKDMAVNLNKASEVITAVTTLMTTLKKPLHDTLMELGVPTQTITNMVNKCRATPRGYTIDKKETLKNIKEKCFPTSNSSITLWEVYIHPLSWQSKTRCQVPSPSTAFGSTHSRT